MFQKAGANFKYISDTGFNSMHKVAFSKLPDAIPFLIKKGWILMGRQIMKDSPVCMLVLTIKSLRSFIKHGEYKYIFDKFNSNKDTCFTDALGSQPGLSF